MKQRKLKLHELKVTSFTTQIKRKVKGACMNNFTPLSCCCSDNILTCDISRMKCASDGACPSILGCGSDDQCVLPY